MGEVGEVCVSVRFGRPFRVKPIGQDTSIIIGAKSPEQADEDNRQGIARFGGEWRAPDYAQAYFQAAGAVVSRALEARTLDELGLPAFHLQRHAVELILKDLLRLTFQALDYRAKRKGTARGDISNGARRRLDTSHALGLLLRDLEDAAAKLALCEPPDSLRALVSEIEKYETTLTWARYPQSKTHDKIVVHVEEESAVPIVALQQRLAQAVRDTGYPPKDGYGSVIYAEWADAGGIG
jgi:hypothetical protein